MNDTLSVDIFTGLSGTYTIGGASPDYPDFTTALNDLVDLGVCGPVVFSVRNGTYNEQLDIPAIVGTDATNTITFEGESGDSSAVILEFNSTVSAQNYVVQMAGGDWFRFRKMTLRSVNANFARVVNFAGDSDNNTFENNQFIGVVTTNTSNDRALVFSASGTTDNGTIFRNNFLKDGSDGIWITGGVDTSNYETGTIVENNRFENQFRRTINLVYQQAPIIDGNVISSNTTYTFYYAIVNYFCRSNQKITNNKFNLNSSLGAIVVEECTGTPNERGLVANNFIQIGGTLQINGIYYSNSTYQNCYFNSVYASSANTGSRPFVLAGGSNLRLLNNIGYNSTGGQVLWRNSTTNIEASNHNNFFTTGGNLAYNSVGNIFYLNLDAWRAGTGFDPNSISVNPQFVSATDLHTTNPLLDGKGTPVPDIQTDIDGNVRNPITPDIGADEYIRDSTDAAIVRFVGLVPPVPAGQTPIRVLVNNNGVNPITSIQLFLSVNNAAPIQVNWSGALAGGDTVTVPLDTLDFSAGQYYLLTAWSAQPNGQSDPNPANDTVRLQTQGLIIHYNFCGCTPEDDSGFGNHATFVGNPACTPGKSGQGVLLNPNPGGNNGCGAAGGQYVQLPPLGPIWQDGISICAWVRFDAPSSFERIFDIGNGSGNLGGMPIWFGRDFTTNNLVLESWISSDGFANQNTGRLTASNAIVNGIYQYYCATIRQDTMRLYVNGVLVAEKKGHPIANVYRAGNFLGHSSWCDPDLRGAIDEVRIFNRGLTTAEISTLYQQSTAFAPFNSPVCSGTPVQLQAQGGTAYQWTPGQFLDNPNIANPVSTPANSITYQCNITLQDGCVVTDSLQIVVGGANTLSGIYTIGGAAPDYPTFAAAVTALATNGVCGPVVFNVRNGTYNEQITIQAISGANETNTVTFQSETGDSTAVILSFTAGASSTPWTLRLLGSRHVVFQRMTIEANSTSWAQAIQVAGSAQFNQLRNNVLRNTATTSTSSNRAVVFCGSGVNSNLMFVNNRFVNGSTGLWFEGNTNSGAYISNIVVDSNFFENQYDRGAYLSYVKKAKVRSNTIVTNSTYTSRMGIRVLNSLENTEVTANRMVSPGPDSYGLYLENITSDAFAPALITNNVVATFGTASRPAIYASSGTNVHFLHNTVRVFNTNADSRALQLNLTSGVIQNNLLINAGGGYAIYRTGGAFVSNYNNLYSSGNRTGFWTSTAATLADWRTLSGNQDINSVAVNPLFASATTYLPRVIQLNNSGTPSPFVAFDIDGQTRNSQNPDIGAFEFTPDSLDAAVLAFVGLSAPVPAGQTPVRVLLKNNGLGVLSSATINLRVNNNAPLVTNWTGNLLSGDTILVELDSVLLLAGQIYDLYAWSDLPNGNSDQFPDNDTAKVLNLLPALNGVYTIGGAAPDFANFAAATYALNLAGVSGPVTFNVRNGTYNETITIGNIPGVDNTKPVYFQSETGDSSLVVLTYSSSAFDAPWTLRLNGADYCTFRRMTIEATGTSYAQAVQIAGDAQNNTFENNILRGRVITSTSTNFAVVFSNSGNNNNLTIKNNIFQNGSAGLHFLGNANGNAYISGIVVDSNKFVNQYQRGVYVEYVNSAKIRGNTLSSNSTYGFYESILVIRGLNAIELSTNRIFNIPTNGDGIILQFITSTQNAPMNIVNNFIQVTGTSTRQGIYCLSGVYANFLHNTVRMLTNNTNGVFYIQSSTNITIRNNIFANSGGGRVFTRTGGGIFVSNYNDLYTTGATLGSWDGVLAADLNAWHIVTGDQDLNSISVNPQFATVGAYKPQAVELNGAAFIEPTVPRDIDGVLRDSQNPDIGAAEFVLAQLDASIAQVVTPTIPFPPGAQPIQAVLKNNGSSTLTSVDIHWELNRDSSATNNIEWTKALPSNLINFGSLGGLQVTGGYVGWQNGAESPAIEGDFVLEYAIEVIDGGGIGNGDCMFGYAKIDPDPTAILNLGCNGRLLYLDQGINLINPYCTWSNPVTSTSAAEGTTVIFTITRIGGTISYTITGSSPFRSGTIETSYTGPVYPVAVFYNNGCRLISARTNLTPQIFEPQPTVAWTGNLVSGATQTVALGSVNFEVGKRMSIRAWTSNPNAMVDQVVGNDTARSLNLYPALSGTYTIGGETPDFPDFTKAVAMEW
ncbi:MAG: right-handed parallel beta-helix repeat-containing protein [Lewinellaceae bacterium]|nr:right-handed parallel beta-helix repeat-containing protein [Lewinellaceae bacterium]